MRTDAILRSSLADAEIASQLSELSLRVILPTGVTSIGEMGAAQGGAAAAAPQPISFALSSWVNSGEADLLVWSGVDFDAALPDDEESDEEEWNTCEEWVLQSVRDLKKTGAGGLTLTDGADGVEKVMIKASPHYKSYRELCGLRRVKAGANVAATEAWRCATNGIVLGIDRSSSFGIPAALLSCWNEGCSLFVQRTRRRSPGNGTAGGRRSSIEAQAGTRVHRRHAARFHRQPRQAQPAVQALQRRREPVLPLTPSELSLSATVSARGRPRGCGRGEGDQDQELEALQANL